MPKNGISLAAFFCCCAFLLSIAICEQKLQHWGTRTEISWDVSGYYLYLPAIFYDHLSELNNRQYIIDNYRPSGEDINAHRGPLGKYVMKYSSGQAIMYLPGFVISHFLAKLCGYPVDGFSEPYELSMSFYSMLICLMGVWFARKVLLFYFDDVLVAFALLLLCFATNYLQYSAVNPMFTHGYLFTVYSIILYLTISWYRSPSYKTTILLGLLAGLAALTRPTEIICVLIPLAWGVGSFNAIRERIKLLSVHWPKVVLFLACAVCVGSIQLIYWKVMSGHFLYWSYDDPNDGFDFLHLPVHACLFGYKKGWWAYTPVMILSAIGFLPLFLRRRGVFWPAIIFSVLAIYLVFSWNNWWYGGSFSQRAVVQYYAVLIFPVTAFLEWVRNNFFARAFTIIFCLCCTYLNFVMTWQTNVSGEMESDNMTKEYYWAIFGRPTVPIETKKLIYTDEVLPSRLTSGLKSIYNLDSAATLNNYRDTFFHGQRLFILDKSQYEIPEVVVDFPVVSSGWFRIHALVAVRQWEENPWRQPYFYVALANEKGAVVKFKSYLVQRILTNDSINDIFIDIKVPGGERIKTVKSGISNNKNDKLVFGFPQKVEYSSKE